MRRQNIKQLNFRGWFIMIFAILLLLVFLSWMSYRFLEPFPPKTLIMATGREGGSNGAFGELYRQVLARDGIHVELLPTSGALENFSLLADKSKLVYAGFVQGTGTGWRRSSPAAKKSSGAMRAIPSFGHYPPTSARRQARKLRIPSAVGEQAAAGVGQGPTRARIGFPALGSFRGCRRIVRKVH